MSRSRAAAVLLALLGILFVCVALLWAQEKPVDPSAAPSASPHEHPPLLSSVDVNKVSKYGCIMTGPNTAYTQRLNAKTKKVEVVKAYDFWELTLYMNDKDGKEIWKFGPVELDTATSARRDCNDWLEATEKRLKASLATKQSSPNSPHD